MSRSNLKYTIDQYFRIAEGIPFPMVHVILFNNKGAGSVEFMPPPPGEAMNRWLACSTENYPGSHCIKECPRETDTGRVLIFDEIDIGVGGEAEKYWVKKLWTLGRRQPGNCITHLPQIAVFADAHFRVHKETSGDRTHPFCKPWMVIYGSGN